MSRRHRRGRFFTDDAREAAASAIALLLGFAVAALVYFN